MPLKFKFFTLLALLFLVLPLFGAGCVLSLGSKAGAGVYKSFDKMDNWEAKNFVSQVKRKITTISKVSVRQMKFDPQNSQTIFLITAADGLYVTYNGGEQWNALFSRAGTFEDIAIDPQERNILYVARGNQIFKSTDGGGQWKMVYLESLAQKAIKSLAVDLIDTNIIYAGLSDGRLLRSIDAGQSWENWANFSGKSVNAVMINPQSPQWIFAITPNAGVFRGDRDNTEWVNTTVNVDTRQLRGINTYKAMVFDSTQTYGVILATQYGLLKSPDAGDNWETIQLLSAAGSYNILSLAVNPLDNKEIYYGTTNALYKTVDGGQTWITEKTPTSYASRALLVKPEDPKIIYLGVYKLE